MKYTVLLVVFVFAFLFGMMHYLNSQQDKPFNWCPKGKQAVLVGSGRDETGTITVLYGCENAVEAKL